MSSKVRSEIIKMITGGNLLSVVYVNERKGDFGETFVGSKY